MSTAIASASRAAHARPRAWRTKLAAGVGGALVMAFAFVWSEHRAPKLPPVPPAPVAVAVAAPPAPALPAIAETTVADLPNAPVEPRSATPARSEPSVVVDRADLLREANRLRGAGKWEDAATTYRRVLDAGGAEAYPAEVALANLEVQRGDSTSALVHYAHALATQPSGALAEEARWGKARALRASGRTSEERAALVDFRAHHEGSALAPLAAKRLAELGDAE